MLGIKGLPYKTVWVEHLNIKSTIQSIGGNPTSKWRDGSDKYTLPAINDPNTSTVVCDSFEIVKYLEKTYPNHGTNSTSLMNGEAPLHAAIEILMQTTIIPPILRLCGIRIGDMLLNEESKKYWWKTTEAVSGVPLDKFCVTTDEDARQTWEDLRKNQEKLAALYEDDKFWFGGDRPVYADCIIAAYWAMVRACFGAESDQWKAARDWNGRKLARMMDAMEKYEGNVRESQ